MSSSCGKRSFVDESNTKRQKIVKDGHPALVFSSRVLSKILRFLSFSDSLALRIVSKNIYMRISSFYVSFGSRYFRIHPLEESSVFHFGLRSLFYISDSLDSLFLLYLIKNSEYLEELSFPSIFTDSCLAINSVISLRSCLKRISLRSQELDLTGVDFSKMVLLESLHLFLTENSIELVFTTLNSGKVAEIVFYFTDDSTKEFLVSKYSSHPLFKFVKFVPVRTITVTNLATSSLPRVQ